MKTVYLVVKLGPEWEIPISAYEAERDANIQSRILNRGLNANLSNLTAEDRLSAYSVKQIKFNPS